MTTAAIIDAAFRRGVRNVKDDVVAALLLDALREGNVERALEAIDIEPAAFEDLRRELVQTYADAGAQAAAPLRGVRWNSANPRVEAYARTQVGGMITNMTEDMRVAVRSTVADGYAFGRSPERIARDLVGRVGPTGRREGGVVGLSQQNAAWVANMRFALENDPASALRYTRRDKRFDRLLRSGRPLSEAQVENILRSYTNKLLLSRGKTIAVTERGKAINSGRSEAFRQAADKYGVGYDTIIKEWVYTNRSREPRVNHVIMNKETVQGLDTPFDVGGVLMMHPHDPAALPEHTVNCSCLVRMRFI